MLLWATSSTHLLIPTAMSFCHPITNAPHLCHQQPVPIQPQLMLLSYILLIQASCWGLLCPPTQVWFRLMSFTCTHVVHQTGFFLLKESNTHLYTNSHTKTETKHRCIKFRLKKFFFQYIGMRTCPRHSAFCPRLFCLNEE